ncbi:MAG TPA: sugar ABC transporter permease [Cellulomonas sp.]
MSTVVAPATGTDPRRETPRRHRGGRQERAGIAFISVSALLFLVFTLVPVLMALVLGFTDYSIIGDTSWVGLDNFRRLLTDPYFGTAMRNTVVYTVLYVPLGYLVALATALLLNRGPRGRTTFRTLFYLPMVSSTVATATIWYWLLNPTHGLLNAVLGWFGIDGPSWLYSSRWAMLAIVLMSVWCLFGGNMLLLLGGLQNIPGELYEAATLDGAGAVQRFWHVTLPGLSRTSFFVLTLLVINAFQVFDQAYVLTQGGPGNSTLTIVYYIYNQGFGSLKMGYASAMSFVLAALILLVSVVNNRLVNRDRT